MKIIRQTAWLIILTALIFISAGSRAQVPSYSCVVKNDSLFSPTGYQFDVYIYQTGTTTLYLNNYQLSFRISNTVEILGDGILSGSYITGSTQLPPSLFPGGVNMFHIGEIYEIRINGVSPNSTGTFIPSGGLRIGTFRILNSLPFHAGKMNLVWWNSAPATTYVYAIVPPAPSGNPILITNMSFHTSTLINPLLNVPVAVFSMTGGGSYLPGGAGVEVGLGGSETGVMYRLFRNSISAGNEIPGTGGTLSFGILTEGTYTSAGCRKATYLTSDMSGSSMVTQTAGTKTLIIKVLLEGLFNPTTGIMNKAQDCLDGESTFDKFTATTADTIELFLANESLPWDYVYGSYAIPIATDGTCTTSVPGGFSGSYYIVVRHRQSVETWSGLPVSFSGSMITYDFTVSPDRAYGNNEKEVSSNPGQYALFSGDVTGISGIQDGYIDIFDNNDVFNHSQGGAYGYLVQDLNGDGFVDIFDNVQVFNNLQSGIGINTPVNPVKRLPRVFSGGSR